MFRRKKSHVLKRVNSVVTPIHFVSDSAVLSLVLILVALPKK